MYHTCTCGKIITSLSCMHCGRVYALGNAVYVEDVAETTKAIKNFIIATTSILHHSSWGDYYDFPIASQETIEAYTKDIFAHRLAVREFLKDYSDADLVSLRQELESKISSLNIADRILFRLGYIYTEIPN